MPFTARVRNFQSIEDATIYVDGLTVLTGTNNAGKTAFLRALRGAFMNSRGHSFVRHGTTHCTVNVEFHNGTVQWEKGPHLNDYTIGSLKLSKVGMGAPAEVQALGVHSLKVGDEQIWPQIASQMSGVQFLLDKPAPLVAEALADVERVNHINRALRSCESDRKKARSDLKAHEDLLQELTAQRRKFDPLDQQLEQLRELELAHAELRAMDQRIRELESLKGRLHACQEVLRSLQGLDQVVVPTDNEVAQVRRFGQALVLLTDLLQRLTKARDTARRYDDGQPLEHLRQSLQGLDPLFHEIEKNTQDVRQLEFHQARVQQARSDLGRFGEAIEQVHQAHHQAQQAVKAALGTFTECPTCGEKVQ